MTTASPSDAAVLAIRVPIAGLLCVAASSWTIRHLGVSLDRLPLIGVAVATISGLYGFLGINSKGGWPERARRALLFIVSTRWLFTLAVVFVLATSVISSVTVLGLPPGTAVQLRPDGQSSSPPSQKLVPGDGNSIRFVALTGPFGRAFALNIAGYNAYNFTLYPWAGAVVSSDRDLAVAPSVCFRLPNRHVELNGRFELDVSGATYQAASDSRHGSLIVGRRTKPGHQLAQDWRNELAASGIPEQRIEWTISLWRNPAYLDPNVSLRPGQTVEVRFVAEGGDLASQTEYTITSEPVQDVLLVDSGK